MSRRRDDRQGMILLNVLVVVAIAAAAVTVMIVAQDIEVQRSTRLHDAAQAQAYSRAGELSAIVALRRDALTTPTVDTMKEPWAKIGQRTLDIPGGSFALTIADEQARFNVNAVARGDVIPATVLMVIGERVGVSRANTNLIIVAVSALAPLRDDGPLRSAGVDPADLDRLAPYITFLPAGSAVNLNTAEPGLMEILLQDPVAVRRIVQRRDQVPVTAQEAASLGPPGLVGARSDHFRVESDVRVGDIRRRTSARIDRVKTPEGWRVTVASRHRLPPA